MANNPETLLLQAKEHFYALRLLEAYSIFRRYFDRIPFQPEKNHAEYIGMFARVLAELGKTSELKFYMGELERWYAKTKAPSIAYQLGIIYCYLPEPRLETAKQIFENLVNDPNANDYRLKARMMLADYHDIKGDLAACRQLIFSVPLEEIADPILNQMYVIWRAKILRDEGKYGEAEAILTTIFETLSPEINWYTYWWSKIILARLLFMKNKRKDAQKILMDVREFLRSKRCRSLENHLHSLEEFGKKHASQSPKQRVNKDRRKVQEGEI